jgi:hypothetical protein
VGLFHGGLVLKAHGLLYHSIPGSRVIKKKKKFGCGVCLSEGVTLKPRFEWFRV